MIDDPDGQRDEFIEQSDAIRDELMIFLRGLFDRADMSTAKDAEEHLAAVYAALQYQASVYFHLLGRTEKTFLDLAKQSLHAAEIECDARRKQMKMRKR